MYSYNELHMYKHSIDPPLAAPYVYKKAIEKAKIKQLLRIRIFEISSHVKLISKIELPKMTVFEMKHFACCKPLTLIKSIHSSHQNDANIVCNTKYKVNYQTSFSSNTKTGKCYHNKKRWFDTLNWLFHFACKNKIKHSFEFHCRDDF